MVERQAVICVPVYEGKILAGERLEGRLKGLVTLHSATRVFEETAEEAAYRSLKEGVGIEVRQFYPVGHIKTELENEHFQIDLMYTQLTSPDFRNTAKWHNKLYSIDALVGDKRMLPGDKLWLPHVFNGEHVTGKYKQIRGPKGFKLVYHNLEANGKKIKEE